ncbi:MAG: pyridoxal 5'-phosphate synthase glutaminase subunit PdxT [Candidatus Rokuibacteriota bacterium]|nr:MAG: pyridoxal 5'-phosphate synthase glutaminase subunit PdxT [Candidatus Rokubacteria bacterium]
MKIGVLALQGDFEAHAKALSRVDASGALGEPVESVEVRKPGELADLDGLIIPGGESTTLLKLMTDWGFMPALAEFHAKGRPLFGTCAGLILLARDVERPRQPSLGLIDVGVERNAYGRQRESFEARGVAELDGAQPVEMIFIRAPRIRRTGGGVTVLARHGDETVMAREGHVLVATFHPELTDDTAVHSYFCRMVERARSQRSHGPIGQVAARA